jgi:hypothetical protein
VTRRTITIDGGEWSVSLAGRFTAYERDEFPVVFERRDAHGRKERRVSRFSPQGARRRTAALAELTEAELRTLFTQSQPDWTSPELDYARQPRA